MSYIRVVNGQGVEVEERKPLINGDKHYNGVLEYAVKITREAWNKEHPNDKQTYEVIKE
jgi:hypothetical protein